MSLEHVNAHVNAGVELFKGAGRFAVHLFGVDDFDDLNPFSQIAHIDGAQDTGVVELAHHATGSGVDDVPDRLTHLGDDPVNAGTDATRERAAAAVADADGMSENERNAYNEARTGPMKETTVKELKMNGTQIIMADGEKGGVHAKRYLVDLPDDTKVKVFTYEYQGADGKMYQETGYVFEKCDNPAVDASADQLAETVTEVAPAPVPEQPEVEVVEDPKPAVSYKVDPYHLACGEIKGLLIADIVLPNADINSPESQAAISKALAEIKAAQGSVGDDFHDFTAIRIVGPDGQVIEVACLEEGSTDRSKWTYVDAQGKKVLITPNNVTEVVLGTLDNHGDGLVAPTMDAQYRDGRVTFTLPSGEEWSREQMENIRADVMSDGSVTEAQFNAMLKATVPPEFFDWSFEQRVRWLQDTFDVPREAARDFANYLGAYTGELGGKHEIIHVPKDVRVTPATGDTFRDVFNRATEAHYKSLAGSIS